MKERRKREGKILWRNERKEVMKKKKEWREWKIGVNKIYRLIKEINEKINNTNNWMKFNEKKVIMKINEIKLIQIIKFIK